jgi:class 3 adenylate cyclase
MQSSKYVVSDTSNISESPTEKAKERRETIILNKPDSLNDVDVIKLSGFLLYQPRKSAPNSGRAKIAAKQVTADFNFSLRSRTKPSVITSHLILAFGYALYLIYEQNRPESDSRGIVPANKPAALFFRIIAIVFSLLISFLATRKSWARKNVSTEIIFMIIILAKSLCVTCIQLMQTVPDYGQLMFDQAFVWTFLPIHPIHAGIYSIIVWLAYSIPKWFGFMPSMNGLNPLIVIAVGIIQSYAHYRRHHGLMTGYLEAKRVEIQRREMAGESSKCDGLLKSMLPPSIIHKLEMGESITPERFDSVTVIFAEICHFSIISRRASAHELVHILNDVFTTFDELIDKWKVYKVETVCQVYMAVAGCPHRDVNHASQSANFALEMISSIQYLAGALSKDMSKNMIDRRQRCVDFFNDDENLEIHVGINSGPVRAGVVGINNPRFKLFGDTVNTASRMESTCEPGRIQISPTAFELLTKSTTHAFELEKRGEIQCKGKGLITTHYVNASNEIKTTTVIETTNTNTGPSNVIESKISAVSLVSKNNERIQNDDSSIIVRDLITNDNSGGNKLDNCILRIRRLSLMIIERDIDVETLRALDKDVPLYRKLMFKKRVNWLQLKILILLMGLSFGLSSTDYWTYLKGDMTQERQIMTLLRNAVAVPIFIFLLISCRNEEWFAKYGEIFSMFSGFVAAAVMLVTIFVVYSGDPGIAAAMCILALDVELLRLSWRIILVFMLLLFYTVMIIMSRGSGVVATLATPYMVCGLFILAIHGQEHFSHLADCEKRDLEMQTKQLHQVC